MASEGISSLMTAAYTSDIPKLILLLASFDVNATDLGRITAIMYASLGGSENKLAAITFLIESGANINAQDADGNTALLCAAGVSVSFRNETISLLLSYGADPDICNMYGDTVITKLTYWGMSCQSASTLIAYGCNINHRNNQGDTTFMLLCDSYWVDYWLIEFLIERIDIDLANNSGRTALFSAVAYNNIKLISLLLSRNASVNLIDKKGNTSLLHAVSILQNPTTVIRLLSSHGANIWHKNKQGKMISDYLSTRTELGCGLIDMMQELG